MANLQRVRVLWGGSPVVGPGVSTFYWDEAVTGFLPALNTFFSSCAGRMPNGLTLTIPNTGDLIDVATGEISGSWSDTIVSGAAGGSANAYAAGVGVRVSWSTSGIRHGRRVRGSTFLVPITTDCYATDGTIGAAFLSTFQSAAGTLIVAQGANMRIYSRPSDGAPGQANPVTGALVPDRISWLRTRRT